MLNIAQDTTVAGLHEKVIVEVQGAECAPVDDSYSEVIGYDPQRGTKIIEVPAGTIWYTPEQQRAYKERQQAEAENRLHRKPSGQFTFMSAREPMNDLTPKTLARLVYLSTYLKYDDCYLYYKSHRMDRGELEKILGLSPSSATKFLSSVMGKYIFIDDAKHYTMDAEYFRRGALGRNAVYQKLMIKTIRELYEGGHDLSKLGYIFRMVPYISTEYNLLCHNPWEQDIDDLDYITASEFCEMSGFSEKHLSVLREAYEAIRIKGDDGLLQVCGFSNDTKNAKIIVNPKVIYRGEDKEKLSEAIGAYMTDFTSLLESGPTSS